MRLAILGPPGTGKGTIASFIEHTFNLVHISTGDLLREQVAKHTSIGLRIAPIMNAGKLVDEETVTEILKMKIMESGSAFILDGYPRTLSQTQKLEQVLKALKMPLDRVLFIDSPESVIVRRLSARRQCVSCKRIYGLDIPSQKEGICDECHGKTILRDDDNPETVRKRIQVYNETVKPLIAFYKSKKLLVTVNGDRSLQEIFGEIEKLLSTIEAKN
ncbi:MAG TPA: adenylate kinase [archaeon]|nr:adenylate kinase [archaeon]